jgi:RNA polymerase sigma factor (sigma-70 family)
LSGDTDTELDNAWKAALRGDREAFQRTVRPYLGELLGTARDEVRYRVALGHFAADDPTPEELVGEVLVQAWREKQSRQRSLPLRAWLLALLYRIAHKLSRRAARLRRARIESLEAPAPPEPIYDDDGEFWEWYQPDEMLRREDVIEARTLTPEEEAGVDEELTRALDPRAREVFLLCELHRVPLTQIAVALGLPLEEAAHLFEEARRDLGLGGDKNLI